MSNIHNLEPQAFGFTTFKTTFGDINIELFTKQCPKATKNFVQLCLDGYYKGTTFERVEKDFIAVGGQHDGPNQYLMPDETFPDEFHSRLRFTRRGLLATANTKKNENGPKFFFTLGPAPELQNKHTIFGRVIGNSVYSLSDLNECQVDDDCCPESVTKILDVIVKENPYPDLLPRARKTISEEQVAQDSSSDSDDPLSRPKPDLGRTKKLSFYPDEDEDEDEVDDQKPVKENRDNVPSNESKSTTIDTSDDQPAKETKETIEGIHHETTRELELDTKEKRLREIRSQIESIKQKIESDLDAKIRLYREDSPTRNKDPTQDVSELDGIKLRIATKKSRTRERETIELVTNFKKKLKETTLKTSKKSLKLSEDKHQYHDNFSDLEELDKVDGDDWMNHKFVAD